MQLSVITVIQKKCKCAHNHHYACAPSHTHTKMDIIFVYFKSCHFVHVANKIVVYILFSPDQEWDGPWFFRS